jgi:DNA repair exonuclease SbcCD ATPase subunit
MRAGGSVTLAQRRADDEVELSVFVEEYLPRLAARLGAPRWTGALHANSLCRWDAGRSGPRQEAAALRPTEEVYRGSAREVLRHEQCRCVQVERRLMSLLGRAMTGLREMPSNAAWLLSQAIKPAEAVGSAAESTTAGARDRGRKLGAALLDAAPVGGDSVELRARRAQEAAERAREAEERALEAARESKALADHARQVSERGRARVTEVDREASRHVKQRVAKAQRAAEELVRRERELAEGDAEEQRQEVREEVADENETAQRDAEESQQRAEELVEEATEKLTEAKRLADEAAEAARAAADEANRQARQLASEAEQQASEAEARVKDAEKLRERSASTAKHTARELDRETTNGGLKSYNKPELVELAASIGIEGRTRMTKGQLLSAIRKASRTR